MISGSHTYTEEAAQSITVVISDAAGSNAIANSTAKVADALLTGVSANISTGSTVSGTIATFNDPDTQDTAGDYSASIDWGDGQTSAGSIVVGTAAGQFHVAGSHSYADSRPHTIAVTVVHGTDPPLVIDSLEPGQINLLGNFSVVEDIYVIGSGTVTVGAAKGVLANDSASSSLSVTTGTVTGASGGTFVFHADGSFTYTPPPKFAGFDYAQYTARDAQGEQGSATVNVLSQTGGVVWKFYESVLNRDPDYGGLQFWINDFVNGGKTSDIAVGFFESDELLDSILAGYYEQYLGRYLDQAGLDYWKGVWRATGGPEGIKAGFAASAEFNNNAGNTVDGWLTALYQRILNRPPDAQGFQYWKEQLAAGMSEQNVALGFFESPEAFKNDVTGWFEEYLGRAPTDTELQQYSNELVGGKTDRDIEHEITNLPEYATNPPSSPNGIAVRLPDYRSIFGSPSSQQASIAAKDELFSQVGSTKREYYGVLNGTGVLNGRVQLNNWTGPV